MAGNPNWGKGKSGNPSGRKKIPEDIKRAFELACPKAIETVKDLMNNSKDDNVRLKASNIIIERHLGKAVQPIGNDESGKLVVEWLK